MIHGTDWYMTRALREAGKAAALGETPVGAVIVRRRDGAIVARGFNRREAMNDVTRHAEMEAIRQACRKTGDWRLEGYDLYVTLEPCPMCAGAILQARLDRVFYGAPDPKAGAGGFNHRLEVYGGILARECGEVLTDFFRGLRKKRE